MANFNPFATERSLPPSLIRLVEHPERGRWQTAIMLRQVQYRWPGWPLEYVLATVDSDFEIHQCDFLVMPPLGWEQRDEVALPDHLSLERVIAKGLLPSQAMSALNAVFGRMCVFHNGSMGSYSLQERFEEQAGVSATWTRSGLLEMIGDHLTVGIGDHARVEFRASDPGRGQLADRARCWAEGYVVAQRAQKVFVEAMRGAMKQVSSD